MYSIIDLFAGAGGLSLGFAQTKKFTIKVAVEKNISARKTFAKNHSEVEIIDDVCGIDYQKLIQMHGKFDIVIGGPPCQGFSNANRQQTHVISMNNRLVKEFVKAVRELNPKAFVMENVGMLRSETHRFFYSEEDQEVIDALQINMRKERLELLPVGIVLENAASIIGDNSECDKYTWAEKDYAVMNVIYKLGKNEIKLRARAKKHEKQLRNICLQFHKRGDSGDQIFHWEYSMANTLSSFLDQGDNITANNLICVLEKPIYIQRMLSKLKELKDNRIKNVHYETQNGVCAYVKSYAVLDYIKAVLESEQYGYSIKADVVNAADFGAPQKRQRFIVLGVKSNIKKLFDLPTPKFSQDAYRTVRQAIADLEEVSPTFFVTDPPIKFPSYNLAPECILHELRDSNIIYNHVITETRETALKRFQALTPGQNFHDLKEDMKTTYSDASRTQNTIYLRLKYDEPSGTVVNVRKSMWIHPTLDRAVSVREAARLQTFPDSFVFVGKKDAQYQQVGNAVPPILAKAIAEKLIDILK